MNEPCAKCGQRHLTRRGGPACTGHISPGPKGQPIKARAGQPCRRAPLSGMAVCQSHGGRAPQTKAKAARRVAEAEAEKILRRFGAPIDTTPTEALLDAVRWTAGYVAWLRDKVAAVEDDEALVWGVTKETDDAVVVGNGPEAYVERVTKTVRESKPNTWLILLGEWSDRLVRICAEAIKAGIEERRVRLAEQQGALVADVIKAILADLDLTDDQQGKVAEVVPLHLRRLAS